MLDEDRGITLGRELTCVKRIIKPQIGVTQSILSYLTMEITQRVSTIAFHQILASLFTKNLSLILVACPEVLISSIIVWKLRNLKSLLRIKYSQ